MKFHNFPSKQSTSSDDTDACLRAGTSPLFLVYNSYVTKLCQKSTFLLSGHDSFDFLQGQLTADCRELSLNHALPTALCSPKGRAITTGIIEKLSDGYLLSVPASMADTLHAHLRKYILFSKVSLDTLPSDILLEAGGDNIQAVLSNHFKVDINDSAYSITDTDTDTVRLLSLPGPIPRWQIRGTDIDTMTELWESLSTVASVVNHTHADYLDLLSHLVTIDDALSEQFLPHMFGYDLIGGMSLKKGCYAGQEVLARSSHRGKIKRHLYHGLSNISHTLSKGMPILNQAGQNIGTLVATSDCPDRHDILAILNTPSLKADPTVEVESSPLSDLKQVSPSLTRMDYQTK